MYALKDFAQSFEPTESLSADVAQFLNQYGYADVAGHCAQVGAEAKRLAEKFGADPQQAEVAGLLHDISAVIPHKERCRVARLWGIEVLPEEDAFPMIIHQKLSATLARELFGIEDEEILSAVSCHTTLKGGSSMLDKVVFVADKVRWDQSGIPPYFDDIMLAIERSLDDGAFCYLDYLWQQRDRLRVVHPWFVDAHQEFSNALMGKPH